MEAWIVWMLALSIAIVAGWVVGVVMALVFGMLEVYSAVWVCYLFAGIGLCTLIWGSIYLHFGHQRDLSFPNRFC